MSSKLRLPGAFAVSAVLLSLSAYPAAALDPNSSDARAIIVAAANSQQADRTASRMKMSIRDRSGTRERLMDVRSKRYDSGRKTLILIEAPADVRNTGFLNVDYQARGQADEQWLYLPKLHRVTRVPNSGKSDAFVGSDFTLSDLSPQDPDNYDVTLLQASVKVGNEDCWLIQATPHSEAVKDETGYEKTQLWVSKEKLVTVQLKAWLVGGKRTKYLKVSDVRKVDGVWTAHRLQMRTLEGSDVASETSIEVQNVSNDAKDVVDSDFTQQRLERGV
jgi:Outer membrane lipoprotein-sorting protein